MAPDRGRSQTPWGRTQLQEESHGGGDTAVQPTGPGVRPSRDRQAGEPASLGGGQATGLAPILAPGCRHWAMREGSNLTGSRATGRPSRTLLPEEQRAGLDLLSCREQVGPSRSRVLQAPGDQQGPKPQGPRRGAQERANRRGAGGTESHTRLHGAQGGSAAGTPAGGPCRHALRPGLSWAGSDARQGRSLPGSLDTCVSN